MSRNGSFSGPYFAHGGHYDTRPRSYFNQNRARFNFTTANVAGAHGGAFNERNSNRFLLEDVSASEQFELGYELPFEPTPDSRFNCPICLGVLRETVQTKCGHRFCAICLKNTKASSYGGRLLCPVDKETLDTENGFDIFLDNAFDREVKSLTTKCTNHSKGCNWNGELRELQDHLKECMEDRVECQMKCGLHIKKMELESHKLVCINRPEECCHCHELVPAGEMMKHHVTSCPKFPVECTFCGRSGVPRQEYESHVDVANGNCPSVIVPCAFNQLGCDFQDQRQEIAKHYETANFGHSILISNKLMEHSRCIEHLERKVYLGWQEDMNLYQFCGNLKRMCDQNRHEIVALGYRFRNFETVSHDGNLLWRVLIPRNEFTATMQSPHFFLGCPGYRFILNLTFPARGSPENIQASLFLKHNRQYDNRLCYPIDGSLKICLLLQQDLDNPNPGEETQEEVQQNPVRQASSRKAFKVKTDFRNLSPADYQESGRLFNRVDVTLTSRNQLLSDGFREDGYMFVYVRVAQVI